VAPDATDSPGPSCAKHAREPAVETCRVCGKAMCLHCMELFGYVCSPLCRARASSLGITVPVFSGQTSVREARRWRVIGWMAGSAVTVLTLFLGAWFWYAWFGNAPKEIFSARFSERSFSGSSAFAGNARESLVFLHGDTLARYDLKTGKETWSRQLLDRKKIAATVEQTLKSMAAAKAKAEDRGASGLGPLPAADKMQTQMERSMAASLTLFVRGESVWVGSLEKLVRYDWASGQPGKEFALTLGDEISMKGDELLVVDRENSAVKHINLATGEGRDVAMPETSHTVKGGLSALAGAARTPKPAAGLPIGKPGSGGAGALDPGKVAQQVQQLPYQAKVALPALVASRMNQDRLQAELDGKPDNVRTPAAVGGRPSEEAALATLIQSGDEYIEMTVKLIEARRVEHSAMKAPPAKSVLEGNLNAAKSLEAANELLNEMQRARGGDKVLEDLSRNEVTLKSPGAPESWTGEVIGPPVLFPLRTVNVLASSKSILVLDKTHKQRWQAPLGFNVVAANHNETDASLGEGPCVERKGVLYVFDEGVLNAFDLASGEARWRFPSVGIISIFFDDQDQIYVNTTTASHESIKYSRQIDVTQVPGAVVVKLNSKDGRVLWRNDSVGIISRMVGKYIFTMAANEPIAEEIEGTSFETGFEKPPFIRIRRLNPRNGKEIWEHFQQRAPLDVQFEQNFIRLVFRKEVQVLKFPTF